MKNNGRSTKILVVEDEGIIGLQIEQTLIKAGYEVPAVAASAEEALLAIQAASPDLVLMDIHIQGELDGVETARKIREEFHLPVIFVTAHADSATLERAQDTEPFGYIVKPISMLSLTSTIEMALHKHQIEIRLQEHRAWLSTILQSIPDAVIVCGLDGRVEFLNQAAERLAGRKQTAALGEDIASFLELHNGTADDVTLQSLHRAVLGADLVPIPRETFLRLQEGTTTPIEGQVAISYSDAKPAGAIFTLRDASVHEREDRQFRQEQKMIAVGQLASDIASDFCGLLSMVVDSTKEMVKIAEHLPEEQQSQFLDDLCAIQHASSMGINMSSQLKKLGDKHSLRPVIATANGVIASVLPVLRLLGGKSLQIVFEPSPDTTSVLCHPDHLEQVLLNVFLNARERLAGSGKLRIATEVVSGNREHVRLSFQMERAGSAMWEPLGFPFEMDAPDLGLSVANAIVTASEGVLRFIHTSETSGELEILLPRQKASVGTGAAVAARRGTVMLVGTDLTSARAIETQLEPDGYVVINSPSVDEALLVTRLYEGRIDIVIADGDAVSARDRERVQRVSTDKNPGTRFMCLTFEAQPNDRAWQAILKPYKARDITTALTALLATSLSAHA